MRIISIYKGNNVILNLIVQSGIVRKRHGSFMSKSRVAHESCGLLKFEQTDE